MTSEHTLGRTYPREWYRVNTFGEILAETFIAETEHKLRQPDRYGRKRYENKASTWYWWHPTLEEAEAHAAKIKSAKDERAAAERVRNAAPDLLEADKDALDTFKKLRADLASIDAELHAQRIAVIDLQIAALSAAISRAEGRS